MYKMRPHEVASKVYSEVTPGVLAHTYNPSTQEAEAGGLLQIHRARAVSGVPGQQEV